MEPLLGVLALVTLLSPSLACPSPCSCSTKKNGRLLAECAYRELRDVPRGLSPNVTILTLSANRLGRLGRSSLAEVPELQSLWLGYNHISFVEPGTFAALPHLKNLDLSHNRLAEFPWQDLRNLSALQILKLSNNRLGALPGGALAGLRELRSLWLNDNELTTLARGTFEALPALAQLQLFHNPFNCSCKLFWLKEWAHSTSVVLSRAGSTLCAAPARLRGRAVTELPGSLCVAPSAQLTYLSSPAKAGPRDGLTLSLHCSVAGSPPPEIRWQIRTAAGRVDIHGPTVARDGGTKASGQQRFLAFKNGTMAIPDFGKEDEGTYTCVAVNDVGTRDVSVSVALSGSELPAEELPRDDPQAIPGGHSCAKGDQPDPSAMGEKLLIVYHVPREVRSAAGNREFRLGILPVVLGMLLW
ncbi:immunoglobulin superfamily containing leucine-rich repeat protein-like isoform X2 [Catharus ustulatus]|uniref:Immunoglobulin superfamily containing leucine rich repeat n=2 Tax=Catharus ustulatus TaxID=91951 RepID=A0A8C3UK21_CATUS|nr:immunoglobulin superfamily containing leucine-rich repeat protein-like isoform X2 [Catharus ustulatus]XP_032926860.1 immunoglobulin superfamily containing leucine-rich repeat protein-like isoform X2 [Catharus ustulatus]